MRPILVGDVLVLARALLAVPAPDREGFAARLITETEQADRHRQATGRAHPVWGDGSVMCRALMAIPTTRPSVSRLDQIAAIAVAADCLCRFALADARRE